MKRKTNLEKALDMFLEEQMAKYQKSDDESLEDHVFSEDYKEGIKQIVLLASSMPTSRFGRFKRMLRQFYYANKAASIVLLTLLGAVSVVSVYATIYHIVHINLVDNDTTADIIYDIDETAGVTLGAIKDYYAPSWIPKGYELTKEDKKIGNLELSYYKSESETFVFKQVVILEKGNMLDNENVLTESTTINGFQGIVASFDDSHRIHWTDGVYQFILYGKIRKEELIQIAESLVIR